MRETIDLGKQFLTKKPSKKHTKQRKVIQHALNRSSRLASAFRHPRPGPWIEDGPWTMNQPCTIGWPNGPWSMDHLRPKVPIQPPLETIGQPLANHWPTIGQPFANHWQAIGQQLANHSPISGQPLANHWSTIGQPFANHWQTTFQTPKCGYGFGNIPI